MDGQKPFHSGTKLMLDLARLLGVTIRIARVVTVAKPPGVVAATVKETLLFLVKLAVGILILLIAVPMIIFTTLPNTFFGYESSDAESVTHMAQQTTTISGIYMNLEESEHTQVGFVVTSIAQEYEGRGETIDRIEVVSHFGEDDLPWPITINSVAYQQGLNTISAEDTRDFCVLRLRYTTSLRIIGGDDAATLIIAVKRLKPKHLMEELGFGEEARVWTDTLYEILEENDTPSEYVNCFKPYRLDYGGDNDHDGGYEHGDSYGAGIDISRFVSPGTKNNADLATHVIQAWENSWGYVWGIFGNVLTESLSEHKIRQYPDGVRNYEGFIRASRLNRRAIDRVGLIKGHGRLDTKGLPIQYGTNEASDHGANQMYQPAVDVEADRGSMSAMSEIMGLAVWKEGHIGVYISGGYVIEAASTTKGVTKTQVKGRGWQGWYRIPCIDYLEEEQTVTTTRLRMFRGAHGIILDELTKWAGFSNQWLSFLELGKREQTTSQEERLSQATETPLVKRHTALSAMERNSLGCGGRLLEPVEVESDEPRGLLPVDQLCRRRMGVRPA